MKTTLNELEREFASDIWQRGREYYREGLVGNVIKNKDIIKAESYGNSTYRLKINLKTQEMECTCPCDFYCKHLAALIIWLKNNKIPELEDQTELLRNKTKEELVKILTNMLEKNPEFLVYLQTMNDEAIKDLIKKLWLPRNNDKASFFNKLDFIKENVMKKKKFELNIIYLRKLVDMLDHDFEFQELTDYVDEYLYELSKQKLTKKQNNEIRKSVENYFPDY